jgi:hypothetical protein
VVGVPNDCGTFGDHDGECKLVGLQVKFAFCF